ncbi:MULTISPECIES: 3'-5' exonuclease [Flavobacteriaceae]|uniref:3'-5' exonuclease n=2 Tax=Flavobacteriaceae TaxID=49546 RepID=A0A4Y8ANN1_9FLAO|nr:MULTISPECIES: 3'-5' exonuclease [Flavobacteriaceae]TEW71879.1 3'-5' exonuclease [Gramella jeungdoensis]GGK60055.1 DNA polymerase III subunit epsilon [Lutibacter litoralis]
MINFFKRKKHPKFWKDYIEKVESSKNYNNYEAIRFVALDTETTGFDYDKDRILCIGAIALKNNKIQVNDSFEVYVKQTTFNKETIKIHGIRKNGTEVKVSEEEALIQFLEYLDDAIIVAHHTKFDITMINQALKRLKIGPLQSKLLDTNYIHKKIAPENRFKKLFSLDELCNLYNITMHDRHTASGDALLTAILFLKLTAKFKKNNILNLTELIRTNYYLS